MRSFTKKEWQSRLRTKKKNTAPGKTGLRVDHMAAATYSMDRKIRAMCNISMHAGIPCAQWLDELVYKNPKDPVAKIDRKTMGTIA